MIWIGLVDFRQAGCYISMIIERAQRVHFFRSAKQAEFRIGRRFELVVCIDAYSCGMIDRDELDLVEIRNLMQFFGDMHLPCSAFKADPGI